MKCCELIANTTKIYMTEFDLTSTPACLHSISAHFKGLWLAAMVRLSLSYFSYYPPSLITFLWSSV